MNSRTGAVRRIIAPMRAPILTEPTEWQWRLLALSRVMTIEQIAEALDCSTRYVSYLKAGARHDPRCSFGDSLRALYAKVVMEKSEMSG